MVVEDELSPVAWAARGHGHGSAHGHGGCERVELLLCRAGGVGTADLRHKSRRRSSCATARHLHLLLHLLLLHLLLLHLLLHLLLLHLLLLHLLLLHLLLLHRSRVLLLL